MSRYYTCPAAPDPYTGNVPCDTYGVLACPYGQICDCLVPETEDGEEDQYDW